MWSGVGISKAETEGRSRRCSYATPHEVITSYRLLDKGCFAFISHCLMSDCKDSTFFTLSAFEMIPFQPLQLVGACCDYCDVTLLHCNTTNVHSYNGWWKGTERGEKAEKGHCLSS